MEMTEDEKDVIPADVVNESVFDTPTEALVSPKEVNCKQAEDKDGAEVEQECALKNGMGDEEKEIEAEEQAKEYTDLFQKDVCHTVDTPEEPAATQQEVASVAEEHHDMELGTVAHVHQDDDPAAEGRVVENEQQEVGTQVAPAAEEEWEVAPANEVVGPASEDEQEEVSVSEKEKPKAPTTEEGEATVAEEKQDVAYGKNKVVPAADEEWEVASEMEKSDSVSVSEKELEVRTEIEDNEVVPKVAKQEVDPSSTELSASLAPDAEEAQAQEEAMDVGNDSGDETDMSEQSYKEEGSQSSGDRPNTLVVEEEEATENEDEMDEEEKNLDETSDSSKGLRGARTSAGPTTSKRTSNRLSKITLQDEEDEQGVEEAVEEDKGMSTEEEKVTTEEEAEHSSDEEAQGQDPPVIDKRVLRGKTKVIQTMQRTRTKRRGKM